MRNSNTKSRAFASIMLLAILSSCITGCTVIGYAIGSSVDSSNTVRVEVTACNSLDLEPGAYLHVVTVADRKFSGRLLSPVACTVDPFIVLQTERRNRPTTQDTLQLSQIREISIQRTHLTVPFTGMGLVSDSLILAAVMLFQNLSSE